MNFSKSPTESLEKLVLASKGGHVLREVQLELEVPGEVKENYGLEPDYYTFELRRLPRSDTLNTTPTIDIPVSQPSSNRDIFNKFEKVWTPGDIIDERDYVGTANSGFDTAGWENFELGNAGRKIKVVNNLYWKKLKKTILYLNETQHPLTLGGSRSGQKVFQGNKSGKTGKIRLTPRIM